jgi:hypothetical protein
MRRRRRESHKEQRGDAKDCGDAKDYCAQSNHVKHDFPPGSTAIVASENEPFAPLVQMVSPPSSPRGGGELRLRIAASRPPQEPTRTSRRASEPAPRLQVGCGAFETF